MIIEKHFLSKLVLQFLDNTINENKDSKEPLNISFKTYLKKDENNCYTILDKENSIKCVFEKKYLKEYLSQFPSYTNFNQFDGMLIMVKRSHFDIIFFKNVNKTISYRIILIITEFILDQAQKISNNLEQHKYININFVPQVEEKLKQFYFKFIQNKIKSENFKNKINNHLNINSENFINNNFKELNNEKSIEKILPKGKDMFFYGGNKENDFDGLNEKGDLSSLKEINLKLENSQNNDENNITLDKLEKLDFKSLFYYQPSQKDKKDNVFTYEKINLNEVNNNKLIGNKRIRGKEKIIEKNNENKINKNDNNDLENDIPFEIKNLYMRMQKNPINIEIFEKYKIYRKLNSNEYSKIN